MNGKFLDEILHAYCILYAKLPNFIQFLSSSIKLCSIKRNRPVCVYISLSASDGELQNQPILHLKLVVVRYFTHC